MKNKAVIAAVTVAVMNLRATAAESLNIEASACKSRQDWKFCTPELELDTAVQAMRSRGTCC